MNDQIAKPALSSKIEEGHQDIVSEGFLLRVTIEDADASFADSAKAVQTLLGEQNEGIMSANFDFDGMKVVIWRDTNVEDLERGFNALAGTGLRNVVRPMSPAGISRTDELVYKVARAVNANVEVPMLRNAALHTLRGVLDVRGSHVRAEAIDAMAVVIRGSMEYPVIVLENIESLRSALYADHQLDHDRSLS